MLFTARDLRYNIEQSFKHLYAYLQSTAQRNLGKHQFDANEVDVVVGHVVEHLVRIGLLGTKDTTPLTPLDRLTDVQFYAYLHKMVQNKSLDRLRKRRVSTVLFTSFANADGEDEIDNLDAAAINAGTTNPFKTPEDIVLELATQEVFRNMLKHCIKKLASAPLQFQALLEEMQKKGVDEIIDALQEELPPALFLKTTIPNASQHRDHAHKKLQQCLQSQSTNLAVVIVFRLIKYATFNAASSNYTVSALTLAQHDLTEVQVHLGLRELVKEKVLEWQGEDVVGYTATQKKQLERFYKKE